MSDDRHECGWLKPEIELRRVRRVSRAVLMTRNRRRVAVNMNACAFTTN